MVLVFGIALLSSCMAPKKIVYVSDMQPDSLYNMPEVPALRVQKNDRLSILVSAKNPELAAPFNVGVGAYKVNEDGSVSTTNVAASNAQGYLVDQQGQIDFPVLGTLDVLGLTLQEVRDRVRDRLVDQELLKDPIVKVEMLNLKVSVVGAVVRSQVLQVPDARITLLEAIAQSGGLGSNAAPDRVTVIREENGVRKRIVNNIESKELFDSPAYYLQQNDIVFVEGRSAENTPREERNWRYFSSAMGAVTFILTVVNFLK